MGARDRIDFDRDRRRRHQAVRLGERRRPVRRVEQAIALASFRLVLFFHQLRLILLDLSLSDPPAQCELGTALRFRIARRADVHRDNHFLARPQKDGPRAAGRSRVPARSQEQGRPQHSLARLDDLHLHHDFLGALGPEQWRRMDDPVPEDGSADEPLLLHPQFAAGTGECGERHFHSGDDPAL